MGKDDPVTEEQCDNNLKDIYERVNKTDAKVSMIMGGVGVLVFLSTFMVGIVSFHINNRFTGLEKAFEKQDQRLVQFMTKEKKG